MSGFVIRTFHPDSNFYSNFCISSLTLVKLSRHPIVLYSVTMSSTAGEFMQDPIMHTVAYEYRERKAL